MRELGSVQRNGRVIESRHLARTVRDDRFPVPSLLDENDERVNDGDSGLDSTDRIEGDHLVRRNGRVRWLRIKGRRGGMRTNAFKRKTPQTRALNLSRSPRNQ